MGASALSALNARGAAAGAYGATLPHVAAARGTLGVQSLQTARNQAIQQRNESYSQAFQQALQQARQNAEAMREFNVNTGLQRRQMSIQQRQFAAGESRREFNITNAYNYAALGARSSGSSSVGGGVAKALGLSQNELDTHVSAAIKLLQGEAPGTKTVAVYGPVDPATGKRYITGYTTKKIQGSGSIGAIQAGVPFEKAVQTLIGQGIRPQIAVLATARIYRAAKNVNVYSWETFVRWMAGHGSKKYQSVWHKWNMTSGGPGTERPPHPP
jgi:hypothetical protein